MSAHARRKQRRAVDRETARERELDQLCRERLEVIAQLTRERNELEERLASAVAAHDATELERSQAEARAHALDCRVADLEETLRLREQALREVCGRSDEAHALIEEVEDVADQHGYPGHDLVGWISQALMGERDAAKLRRRLHERSRELSEARAEIGRLERKVMA